MSDQSITRPQAPPVATDAPSAHDLVVADMNDRKEFGLQKYGTLLQHNNGREHLVDAYQEVLDLAVYLRNEIEARRNDPLRVAALALYRAGHWVLKGSGTLDPPPFAADQARLWEALRDALGLPAGTTSAPKCTACRGTGHRLDADQRVAGLGPCDECGGLGIRLP